MKMVKAGETYFDLDEVLYATDRGVAKRGRPDGVLLIRFRGGYILSLAEREMQEALAHLSSGSGGMSKPRPSLDGS